MKNDDKVIAKLPLEEKQEFVELSARLDLTLSQVVREALLRFKPILVQRVAEKEQAIAVPAETV